MKQQVSKDTNVPAMGALIRDVRAVVAAPQNHPELGAMSIDNFCERYHINRKTLWDMRRNGTAPDVLLIGRKVLITYAAAREWEARMIERSRVAPADAEADA